ncbi:hypothetical protein DBR42_14460 [Pelomonas sp. HMWF004]|nr:hypothetical protein DBR42_14460 [Pelomonas sp. HMWF004]
MLIKNLLVFIHLIAMAVAVGKMLEFDLRFLRASHVPPNGSMRRALHLTRRTMESALVVLWITGLALVAWAWRLDANALLNEKLWMKVLTVCCLTLNGALMHRYAFPLLQGPRPFLALPLPQLLGLTVFAAVSSVSWMYASFLGIARSWNHSTPFAHALTVSLALLSAAAIGGMIGISLLRARYLAQARTRRFPPTMVQGRRVG